MRPLHPKVACKARQFCGKVSGPPMELNLDTNDISHLPASAPNSSTIPAVSESALADARATETVWSLSEAHTALAHADTLRVWGSGWVQVCHHPTRPYNCA